MDTVADTVWSPSWTGSLIKFIIMSVVFLTALILMFTLGNLNEIRKNFPRYRCNPLFIPFASQFGYDTKDNFNFCLSTIFDTKAAEIFGPIYQLLAGFVGLTKVIVDVALGIRKLFSNFLLGVNGFVRSVRDRIQTLMFNIRMSFLKLNHLMGRVYGTMYAVIWMGTSAMTAGFNISDNSLVQFLFEFCFDPETPLRLVDGTYIPIKDARIGMKLAPTPANPTPEITSVFLFDGSKTPMVRLFDTIMSSEHYVNYKSAWIPAKLHPDAEPAPSIPRLVCLNVTGHEFKVGYQGLIVADYDEHSTKEVIETTQVFAETCLNGPRQPQTSHIRRLDYDLGLGPDTEIYMQNQTWKQIQNIQIGDNVWNAGPVVGIVNESVQQTILYKSICMSPAQLVFDPKQQCWKRNLDIRGGPAAILTQVVTKHGAALRIRSIQTGEEMYVRDYREVAHPDMERAYSDAFHMA
jgi:hypothetical protein